ncbi:unnamed protein product [Ectocarpus sp. CCAP 1310/34]|nr:unnamed protein product [Ectocarpus sp. CCAP 1310/34]
MKAAFNDEAYAAVLRENARVDRLVSHASAAGSPLLPASPRNSQSGPPSGGTQIVLPAAGAISPDDISSGKVSAPARQAPVFNGSQEYYNDEVFLFLKPPPFLSNWTPCEFSVHGIRYVCGEQFMMAEKARIFGDDAAYAKIMATSDPREHKSLGRKIRRFDHALWKLRREDVVFSLLYAKFAQNADARERLLATGDRQIAEASPYDGLWDIGVDAFDPRAASPSKWTGCAELEPGDVLGVATAPLVQIPLASIDPTPQTAEGVGSSDPTPPTRSENGPPSRVTSVHSNIPVADPKISRPHCRRNRRHRNCWNASRTRSDLADVLCDFSDVFSRSPSDFDCCSVKPFRLEVPADAKPLASRPYRLNPLVEKKVDAILDQCLAAGLIQHSQSPWASPLVVIPKKDGNLRLTVNYKKLNKLCSLGQQPQPRVDHIIDSLHKGKVFSIFDLNSAFHRITVEEDTGSSVAPSWFTMVINEVVNGLDHVLAYLDDVIVFDADPVHHVANIRLFLECLRKYNLKLSPLKSRVGAKEAVYLGHTISPAGVSPRADEVEALTNMPLPNNVKQLRSLLGGLSYYRKFIKGLAVRVKPLADFLREDAKFCYTPAMVDAVKVLLAKLSEPPVLAFPDWDAVADGSRPLRLCCDACVDGFGAAFEQEQADGSVRPILFVSRATLESERNWTVLYLEAGSIVWAIKRLRGYFGLRTS